MNVDGNIEIVGFLPESAVLWSVVVPAQNVVVNESTHESMLLDTTFKLLSRLFGVCHGQDCKAREACLVVGDGSRQLVVRLDTLLMARRTRRGAMRYDLE